MKVLLLIFSIIVSASCECTKGNCGPTVEVGLYYESLCPDSRQFVLTQLYPTFHKLSTANPPALTINIVPFGNADMEFAKNSSKNPKVTFTCQHGLQECIGNYIQSCAVMMTSIEQSLGLVNCMFASPQWRKEDTMIFASECAKKLNLNWGKISECANSEDGVAIEYFMRGQTLALEPPKKGVPWITINGQHNDDIQKRAETDLLKLVCDTYKGPKPDACKS